LPGELIALLTRALILADSEGSDEISVQHLRAAYTADQPDSSADPEMDGLQPVPRLEKPLSKEASALLEEAFAQARAEGGEPLTYVEQVLR
jgi:nucleotide-binding universal stress UspA family protein